MYIEAVCPVCGEMLEIGETVYGKLTLVCECCGYTEDDEYI